MKLNKTNHKVIAFLLVILLVLGTAPAAFADVVTSTEPTPGIIYKGESAAKRWLYQNIFKDKETDTQYTSTDLFSNQAFKDVMPGDILEQKFVVKNRSSADIKLFMEVLPHGEKVLPNGKNNDLSAAAEGYTGVKPYTTTPQMIEFLNQLSMQVTAGKGENAKVLFNIPANPENNPEIKGLGTYYGKQELGILEAGYATDLYVKLIVPIEMGNKYAFDLAEGTGIGEVDFKFTIEEYSGGGGPTPDPDEDIPDPDVPKGEPDEPIIIPGEPVEDIPDPEVPLGDAPKTGDNTKILPLVLLMLAAMAGLVVTRKKFN